MNPSSVQSKLLNDNSDSVWNHHSLLNMKKSSLIPVTQNPNSFLQILPCIRRLYTIFDSICPNIYRIHCSDSWRTLSEILCLIEEYLHIIPLAVTPTVQLLSNEKCFEDLISKLRRPSIIRQKSSPSIKPDLYCFGQGIQTYNSNNQLNQTMFFCFELTNKHPSPLIDVLILDPNENLVPTDVKYIHTYLQGHTKLFSCSYTPTTKAGTYKIFFTQNNHPIANPSYSVLIHQCSQTSIEKSLPEIPEYDLEGSMNIVVNSIARFRLQIKSSITLNHSSLIDLFTISILDPHGHSIVVQRRILSPEVLELTYQPMSIGEHHLKIFFNQQIHRQVIIDVIKDELNYLSKLKPFGPGLRRAIVDLPTEFYVDLNQTINSNIHFRLEPSYQAEIDYEQQLATVRYIPTNEGNCPIQILEDDREISHSPFIAHVERNIRRREKPCIRVIDLSKRIILHRPLEFQVFIDNPFDEDISASLYIDILTDDDSMSPSVSIRRRHRSSYICSFIPQTLGRHLISIDYAGIVAEHNPFHCQATQEKDILLTGPAIHTQCLPINESTHFYFALKDFFATNVTNSINTTSESGYSSNDDISLKSSLSSSSIDAQSNYRVTITDGHGNVKQNVHVQENCHSKSEKTNKNVRVDFTPDEKILYINVSCTW